MKRNPFSLVGKNILVTGASSGIGRSVAIECSKMGAKLIITGRNQQRLTETYELLDGKEHLAIVADLTRNEDLDGLVEQLPLLNGLVHSAGINKRMVCQFIKEDDMNHILNINLLAPILLQKKILKKKLLANSSSILFLSSLASHIPSMGNAVYSASKGAICSYSKVLALELAPKKIRVNCIHPGMVWTELLVKTSISEDIYKEDENRYPLGRYGMPSDIAFLTIYLLSDASEWMTGSSLFIDGGSSLI